MKLMIPEPQLVKIQQALEDAYPNEGCGFFLGKDEGDERWVQKVLPVENHSNENQKRRFAIDPKDYLKAEKMALAEGLVLQGIFHSHPEHPARPSEHDLKSAVPFFSYIIISVLSAKSDTVTSWTLGDDGRFHEEEIVIHKSQQTEQSHG